MVCRIHIEEFDALYQSLPPDEWFHINYMKKNNLDAACKKEKSFRNLIISAVFKGDLELLKTLIRNKAFNRKLLFHEKWGSFPYDHRYQFLPLSLAARLGKLDIIEELVRFFKNSGNPRYEYPLHIACYHRQADAVQMLVKHLPHLLEETDRFGCSPLQVAASRNSNAEAVKILIEAGAGVDTRASSTPVSTYDIAYYGEESPAIHTSLQIASYIGDVEVVEALLMGHADPLISYDTKKKQHYLDGKLCPLVLAAQSGSIDTLKSLSKIIPLDETRGRRAVAAAAYSKCSQCLEFLWESGAPNMNTFSEDELRTVWFSVFSLYPACDSEKCIETVQLLLHRGASLMPLATMDSKNLVDRIFRNISEPLLSVVLNYGILDLRYSTACQTPDGISGRDLLKHDLAWIVSGNCTPVKMLLILKHCSTLFCEEDCIAERPKETNRSFIDSKSVDKFYTTCQKVSPLQRLCQVLIRRQISVKYGFISCSHISQLDIPKPLQRSVSEMMQ